MEYTVSELLRIALGSSEMTPDCVTILYAVIRALLRKLNCEGEIVKIYGEQGACLQEILKKSRKSTVDTASAQYNNIQPLTVKFKKLESLEQQANIIDGKLKKHFTKKRNLKHRIDLKYDGRFWGGYITSYEDMCTVCTGSNTKGDCQLIQNGIFNCKLRSYMLSAVMERMDYMESVLSDIEQRINEATKTMDETMGQLDVIAPIIGHITLMKKDINQKEQMLVEAIKECDDMILCKLDRVQLPCIMNYLRKRFYHTGQALQALMNKNHEKCQVQKVFKGNGKCLSCDTKFKFTPMGMPGQAMKLECKDYGSKVCSQYRPAGLFTRLVGDSSWYKEESYDDLGYFKYENSAHRLQSISNYRLSMAPHIWLQVA